MVCVDRTSAESRSSSCGSGVGDDAVRAQQLAAKIHRQQLLISTLEAELSDNPNDTPTAAHTDAGGQRGLLGGPNQAELYLNPSLAQALREVHCFIHPPADPPTLLPGRVPPAATAGTTAPPPPSPPQPLHQSRRGLWGGSIPAAAGLTATAAATTASHWRPLEGGTAGVARHTGDAGGVAVPNPVVSLRGASRPLLQKGGGGGGTGMSVPVRLPSGGAVVIDGVASLDDVVNGVSSLAGIPPARQRFFHNGIPVSGGGGSSATTDPAAIPFRSLAAAAAAASVSTPAPLELTLHDTRGGGGLGGGGGVWRHTAPHPPHHHPLTQEVAAAAAPPPPPPVGACPPASPTPTPTPALLQGSSAGVGVGLGPTAADGAASFPLPRSPSPQEVGGGGGGGGGFALPPHPKQGGQTPWGGLGGAGSGVAVPGWLQQQQQHHAAQPAWRAATPTPPSALLGESLLGEPSFSSASPPAVLRCGSSSSSAASMGPPRLSLLSRSAPGATATPHPALPTPPQHHGTPTSSLLRGLEERPLSASGAPSDTPSPTPTPTPAATPTASASKGGECVGVGNARPTKPPLRGWHLPPAAADASGGSTPRLPAEGCLGSPVASSREASSGSLQGAARQPAPQVEPGLPQAGGGPPSEVRKGRDESPSEAEPDPDEGCEMVRIPRQPGGGVRETGLVEAWQLGRAIPHRWPFQLVAVVASLQAGSGKVCCCADRGGCCVRVFQLGKQGKELDSYPFDGVQCLASDGDNLVVAGAGTLRCVTSPNWSLRWEIPAGDIQVLAAGGGALVFGQEKGPLRLSNLSQSPTHRRSVGLQSSVAQVRWTTLLVECPYIVALDGDSALAVWLTTDLTTCSQPDLLLRVGRRFGFRRFTSFPCSIRSATHLSACNSVLATKHRMHAFLWETVTGRHLVEVPVSEFSVIALAGCAEDGIFVVCDVACIRVYDLVYILEAAGGSDGCTYTGPAMWENPCPPGVGAVTRLLLAGTTAIVAVHEHGVVEWRPTTPKNCMIA